MLEGKELRDLITRDMIDTLTRYRLEAVRLDDLIAKGWNHPHRQTRVKKLKTTVDQIPAFVASLDRRRAWCAEQDRLESMAVELEALDQRLIC